MKLFNYMLIAVLCTVALVSCQKDNNATIEGETKNVTISVAGLSETRANPIQDMIDESVTPDVKNMLIFVTTADGTILRAVEVAKGSTDWGALIGGGLTIPNVGVAAAKIKVYGNYTGVVSTAGVVTANFANQQGTDVLFVGENDFSAMEVSPVPTDGTNVYTYNVAVNIAPIVSRIEIKSITFAAATNSTGVKVGELPGADPEDPKTPVMLTWTGFSGELLGVYFNNFYNTYDGTNVGSLKNNTAVGTTVAGGNWLFGSDNFEKATYNGWNGSTAYEAMAALPSKKCYAFNFFPGATPQLFFNVNVDGNYTLTPEDAYDILNTSLIDNFHWVLVKKYTLGGNDFTDFKPGMIYDLDITIEPQNVQADFSPVKYNIVLKVTIKKWGRETLLPVFEEQ